MSDSWKHPSVITEDGLAINEAKTIRVHARDYFSRVALKVNKGELYEFKVDKKDKWIDLCIPSSAKGFRNILLKKRKRRVTEVCCFHLCGTIGMDDEHNFSIGLGKQYKVSISGKMHFFANDQKDSRFANLNNWGSLNVRVKRLA